MKLLHSLKGWWMPKISAKTIVWLVFQQFISEKLVIIMSKSSPLEIYESVLYKKKKIIILIHCRSRRISWSSFILSWDSFMKQWLLFHLFIYLFFRTSSKQLPFLKMASQNFLQKHSCQLQTRIWTLMVI